MRLLLVCPLKREFKECANALHLGERLDHPSLSGLKGTVGGVEVIALKSGLGKRRTGSAVARVIDRWAPSLVIDTGTCGALDPALEPGDIVVATDCYEFEDSKRVDRKRLIPSVFEYISSRAKQDLKDIAHRHGVNLCIGRQACAESFVNSARKRRALHKMLSAVSTNWETSAVFLTAFAKGTFALSLRVVSDSAERGALLEFVANIKKVAHRLYSFLGYLIDEAWFEKALDGFDRSRDDILSSAQQWYTTEEED